MDESHHLPETLSPVTDVKRCKSDHGKYQSNSSLRSTDETGLSCRALLGDFWDVTKYFPFYRLIVASLVHGRQHFRELPFFVTGTEVWQVRLPVIDRKNRNGF